MARKVEAVVEGAQAPDVAGEENVGSEKQVEEAPSQAQATQEEGVMLQFNPLSRVDAISLEDGTHLHNFDVVSSEVFESLKDMKDSEGRNLVTKAGE